MKFKNLYNRGFSILELLLVVGVFAMLAAFVSSLVDSWYRDNIDRKVVNEIRYLQTAAEDYTRLNFTDIIPPLGNTIEIDIDDLILQNYLPSGYNNLNSHKQEMRVFISHSSDSAVNGSVIDVLTVTDNPTGDIVRIPNNRLLNVAANSPELGIVSNLNLNSRCCRNNIQSINNLWSIPLSSMSSLYTARGNDDGGYLAAYGRVSIDDEILGNYLYRVPIPSLPNANTMEVNLDMGENDIINSNAIISDGLTINGSAIIDGNNNELNIPYVLMTSDDIIFSRNLDITSNDTNKGNVIIKGDNGIGADFTVANTLTVQLDDTTGGGVVSSQEMSTNTMNTGGRVNFENANLNSATLDAGNIYSRRTRYTNAVNTMDMQAIEVRNVNTTSSANLVAESVTINNSFTAPQNLNVDNQLNVTGNSNINGSMNAYDEGVIYNMSRCGSGCP